MGPPSNIWDEIVRSRERRQEERERAKRSRFSLGRRTRTYRGWDGAVWCKATTHKVNTHAFAEQKNLTEHHLAASRDTAPANTTTNTPQGLQHTLRRNFETLSDPFPSFAVKNPGSAAAPLGYSLRVARVGTTRRQKTSTPTPKAPSQSRVSQSPTSPRCWRGPA